MRIIASFIISIIGAFMFTGFFNAIVPRGNSDVKIVIGLVVFIVGEIAVYANIILDKCVLHTEQSYISFQYMKYENHRFSIVY